MASNSCVHRYLCKNIGIKHDFLCINICWALREVLKPESEMLMYQKSMFDSYYCIKTFFRSKTLEKLLQKVLFSCTYNGEEKHVTCPSRAKTETNVIATVHNTDDVSFYDGPGMLIHKTAKPCINST